MKTCKQCGAQLADTAAFCPHCGTPCADVPPAGQPQPQQAPPLDYYQQPPNYYDHTSEFDLQDISQNKVMCMIVYLMGTLGIIIAMLASSSSPYVAFHVRQALKLTVLQLLITICTVLLFWTIIVPVAYFVMLVVLLVIRIICFFQICNGRAVEPAIVRSMGFLR